MSSQREIFVKTFFNFQMYSMNAVYSCVVAFFANKDAEKLNNISRNCRFIRSKPKRNSTISANISLACLIIFTVECDTTGNNTRKPVIWQLQWNVMHLVNNQCRIEEIKFDAIKLEIRSQKCSYLQMVSGFKRI